MDPFHQPAFVCESCKEKRPSPKPAMSKATRALWRGIVFTLLLALEAFSTIALAASCRTDAWQGAFGVTGGILFLGTLITGFVYFVHQSS